MAQAATLILVMTLAVGCASRVGYDADTTRTCPAHDLSLRDDTVPMVYGLPVEFLEEGYAKTRKKRFPYANTWGWGGCVTIQGVPMRLSAKVRYCTQCRTNYATWIEQKEREWSARKSRTASSGAGKVAREQADARGRGGGRMAPRADARLPDARPR